MYWFFYFFRKNKNELPIIFIGGYKFSLSIFSKFSEIVNMEEQSMFGLPSRGVRPIGPNLDGVKERAYEKAIEEGNNPSLGPLSYSLPT